MREDIAILLERMHHPSLQAIEPGLERVGHFLELIGSPHKRLPPVVHVAGTNGKGSLIAYLGAILEAAGYSVHRYISPHLIRFNERIQLNGKPIDNHYLASLLQRVVGYIDQQPVTFFESTTAAAFLAFSERPADILLLETGMGGRLDATNVVEKPLLTAITPISLDHCNFLGNTIPEIAAEKAGILKQGVPCVVGRQRVDAGKVIEKAAKKLKCPLYRYDKEWQLMWEMGKTLYESPKRTITLNPSLAGRHQFDNAASAVACADMLEGFNVSNEHIAQGLAHTVWPARLQRLTQGRFPAMLPKGMELWLDGGHNAQGADALAQWIGDRNMREVYLVCGMIKSKDSLAYLRPLTPYVTGIYTVAIEDEPTSQMPEQLEMAAREAGMAAMSAPSVEKALQSIAQRAKTPAIICICGSLYLAGKVLAANEEEVKRYAGTENG